MTQATHLRSIPRAPMTARTPTATIYQRQLQMYPNLNNRSSSSAAIVTHHQVAGQAVALSTAAALAQFSRGVLTLSLLTTANAIVL